MKKSILQAIVLLLALSVGGTTRAEDFALESDCGCDTCGADSCDCDCCDGGCGGWVGECRAMFMR